MKMLYPNCSEWNTRVKVIRLDDLSDKEKEVMELLSKGQTDGFPLAGNYLENSVDYDYMDYEKLKGEFEKLPFWNKVVVENGDG